MLKYAKLSTPAAVLYQTQVNKNMWKPKNPLSTNERWLLTNSCMLSKQNNKHL